jgi:chemotaxis protein CheD
MSAENQNEPASQFTVGLAELAVRRDQNATLCSSPLGACLGVIIYDPAVKVGGLLHSLLPASSIAPARAADRPGMFLDTGLAAMLERARELGAQTGRLQVFVAGGAQILDESTAFNIGTRNYAALKEALAQHGLQVYAEDVGGRTNRTMQINLATGDVRVKYSGQTRIKSLCKPSTTT